ncbi:hypothetical protein NL676_024932 [Syzygium grande]|nr:hypothetical protein NL676_024932 [Syzygium grande]
MRTVTAVSAAKVGGAAGRGSREGDDVAWLVRYKPRTLDFIISRWLELAKLPAVSSRGGLQRPTKGRKRWRRIQDEDDFIGRKRSFLEERCRERERERERRMAFVDWE